MFFLSQNLTGPSKTKRLFLLPANILDKFSAAILKAMLMFLCIADIVQKIASMEYFSEVRLKFTKQMKLLPAVFSKLEIYFIFVHCRCSA